MRINRLYPAIIAALGIWVIMDVHAATGGAENASSAGSKADADVVFVRAVKAGENTWTFHVTVRHPDTGWKNYADGWDVLPPDGKVIKTRSSGTFTRDLAHPHVDEQPFTRSASGIVIPLDVSSVRVRAHDSVDGFGGKEVVVNLKAEEGEGFKLER